MTVVAVVVESAIAVFANKGRAEDISKAGSAAGCGVFGDDVGIARLVVFVYEVIGIGVADRFSDPIAVMVIDYVNSRAILLHPSNQMVFSIVEVPGCITV